jgi:DNA-binding response OmpR family regulator
MRHLVEGTGLTTTEISEAGSQAEAVALLREQDVDVVLVEIQMPVEEGLETITALRRLSSSLRIVVCSFHGDATTRERARLGGADDYLDKPMGIATLKAALVALFLDFSPGSTPPSPEEPPSPAVPVGRPSGVRVSRPAVDQVG